MRGMEVTRGKGLLREQQERRRGENSVAAVRGRGGRRRRLQRGERRQRKNEVAAGILRFTASGCPTLRRITSRRSKRRDMTKNGLAHFLSRCDNPIDVLFEF